MTHYIRRNGKTLVDCDASKDDLSITIIIEEYSKLLLAVHSELLFGKGKLPKLQEFIHDFDDLQELRAEWFETPDTIKTDKSPDALAARRLKEIGKKYDLQYITD